MQNFIFFVFCLFLTYIQVAALPIFFEAQQIPNLVLSFIVSITVLRGFQWSAKWILLLGILMDVFSFQPLGLNILGFLVGAIVAYEIRSAYHLRAKRVLFLVLLEIIVLLSKLSFDISRTLVAKLLELTAKYPYASVQNFFSFNYLLAVVYTLIFAVPMYLATSRFIAWLYRNQSKAIIRQ
jgi:rod shape-determining protein MreD